MENEPTKTAIAAWASLFEACQNLRKITGRKLSKAKLPPLAWYDVLWAVYRSPDKQIRQYHIGRELLLEKHNLSRLLDRLETEGMITRLPCNKDKRGKYIQISDKGVLLLKTMWQVYGTVIQENFSVHFDEKELEQLAGMLSRCTPAVTPFESDNDGMDSS